MTRESGPAPHGKVPLPPEQISLHFALARPRSPVLISSANADGSLNVAPFNWNTPISVDPPLFCVALQERPQRSDTLGNIERTGQFVVNFPGLDVAGPLVASSYEYPEGTSKFTAVGFTPLPSRAVVVAGVAECRAHLECELADVVRPAGGDHALVVARVVAACYDAGAWTGELIPRLDPVPPAVHLGQRRVDGGQVHFFFEPARVAEVFVPYSERRR